MHITKSASKEQVIWLDQLDRAVSSNDEPEIWRLMEEA
jgi:hypothetical protein